MFKLVVLFALVAVAVAKPGYLGGHLGYSALAAPLAVHAPVAVAHSYAAIPAAVSHSYRKDIISKPIVAAYAAPLVAAPLYHKTIVAAPAYAPISYAAHGW